MISFFHKKSPVHLLLIILIGLMAYSNTLEAPFTFDDEIYITKNPVVRDSGYFTDTSRADGLRVADVVKRYLKTRYVPYLSFRANYAEGGLNVEGYHVVNIAIHLINSMLLYALVVLIFKTPILSASRLREKSGYIALFSALMFVAHPVQTEAVTYITQRFTSMAAMFCLLSFVLYLRYRLSASGPLRYLLYALCIVSAVLAMKSKENAFMLPVLIAGCEFFFFEGRAGRRLLILAPLLLTMLIIPAYYMGEGMGAGGLGVALGEATRLQTEMPRSDYLFTQFRVVTTYTRLLFLPVNQNFDYDYPLLGSLLDARVLVSSLYLLSVIALGAYLACRSRGRPGLRLVSFGVFWFFVALSVESSFMPISEIIYEYRVYLPSAGAVVGITASLFIISSSGKNAWAGKAVMLALLAVVIMLSALTYARNSLWLDQVRLLEDTVRKSPLKARPHVNLGHVYSGRGQVDEAIEEYEAALGIDPYDVTAHDNLGSAYLTKGMVERAIEHYRAALMVEPYSLKTIYNLGVAYQRKGLVDKAIESYKLALTLSPDSARTRLKLGRAYLEKGWPEKAGEELRTALRLDPSLTEARELLDGISR
jgi:tetratricopeptide (TPR) repeat protein